MNKQTQMLLLLALAGGAAYWFLVKKPADEKAKQLAQLGYTPAQAGPSDAQFAAQIAQAQADAAIASAEAQVKIAEAQAGEWYTPLVGGLGEGGGKFLGGLSGLF